MISQIKNWIDVNGDFVIMIITFITAVICTVL